MGFKILGIPWEVGRLNNNVNLKKQQESAIVGMILGDGYLQPTGKKNARLRLEHKLEHRAYLVWKTKLLPQLFQGSPQELARIHPVTKKTYYYVRHQSQSTPILGKMRSLFYPDGKKRIPKNLVKLLRDEIAFAIWFYDDGYYSPRDNSVYLYLGKVLKEEAEIAQRAIYDRFHISSTILDKKQKGFVLYVSPRESKKVKFIVEQYYVPVMAYKIPP